MEKKEILSESQKQHLDLINAVTESIGDKLDSAEKWKAIEVIFRLKYEEEMRQRRGGQTS